MAFPAPEKKKFNYKKLKEILSTVVTVVLLVQGTQRISNPVVDFINDLNDRNLSAIVDAVFFWINLPPGYFSIMTGLALDFVGAILIVVPSLQVNSNQVYRGGFVIDLNRKIIVIGLGMLLSGFILQIFGNYDQVMYQLTNT